MQSQIDGLRCDFAKRDKALDARCERLHPQCAMRLNHTGKLMPLCFTDQMANRVVRDENLGGDASATADSVNKALTYDSGNDARQLTSDIGTMLWLEAVDHSGDGRGGIRGMKRTQDEMASFGGDQRRPNGCRCPHLADHDHVRIATQCADDGFLEGMHVATDFALRYYRTLAAMQVLDRVFDRDHMTGRCPRDLAHDCG